MMTSVRPPLQISARTARALSVAVFASLVTGYGTAALGGVSPFGLVVAGVFKIVGLLGAIALFVGSQGQQANAPDRLLDERQRGERDRAHVRAFHIVVAAMFAAFLYTIPARAAGWWLPGVDVAIDMLSAFAIFSMALPGVVLAWRAIEAD